VLWLRKCWLLDKWVEWMCVAALRLLLLLLLLHSQVPVIDIVRSRYLLRLLNVLDMLHRWVLQRYACAWYTHRTVRTGCEAHARRVALLCQG